MLTYTFSLPGFSKEDERLEVEGLSDAEKEAILNDKYGNNRRERQNGGRRNPNNNADDATSDSEAAGQVVAAILNVAEARAQAAAAVGVGGPGIHNDPNVTVELLQRLDLSFIHIPYDQSRNYFVAGIHAPFHVLNSEANPVRFLRSEDYNPQRAAIRLCEYWNMRVAVFGYDKAFQPLALDCALKDVVPYFIEISSFMRILPDDDDGRTVICMDRTDIRWKDCDESAMMKITWFVFHEALRRQSTQEKGVVLVVINQSSSWDFASINFVKMHVKSICNCIPVKINCIHVVVSSLMMTVMVPMAKLFSSRRARLRFEVHNNILKKSKVLNDLDTFGLHSENLPKSIGGNYITPQPWIDECEEMCKEEKKFKKLRRMREISRMTSSS